MTTETARKDAYRREMEEDLLKPQWEQCCGQFELREGTKGRSNSMHFLFPLQYVAKKVYDFNFGLDEGEVYIFPSGMIKEGCSGILPVYEAGKRYNFMNGVKMFLQRYLTKVESSSFNQVLPHGSVIVITSSRLQDFKHATNSKVREVQGVCEWQRCEKGNFVEILKSAGEEAERTCPFKQDFCFLACFGSGACEEAQFERHYKCVCNTKLQPSRLLQVFLSRVSLCSIHT